LPYYLTDQQLEQWKTLSRLNRDETTIRKMIDFCRKLGATKVASPLEYFISDEYKREQQRKEDERIGKQWEELMSTPPKGQYEGTISW
jgi:hypothetical protein